jgi:hypothetical protein
VGPAFDNSTIFASRLIARRGVPSSCSWPSNVSNRCDNYAQVCRDFSGFRFVAFQSGNVGQILRAANSPFVGNEMQSADDRNRQTRDLQLKPISPGITEFHAVDGCQNVDSRWRNTNLKNDSLVCEIIFFQVR